MNIYLFVVERDWDGGAAAVAAINERDAWALLYARHWSDQTYIIDGEVSNCPPADLNVRLAEQYIYAKSVGLNEGVRGDTQEIYPGSPTVKQQIEEFEKRWRLVSTLTAMPTKPGILVYGENEG